MHVYTKMYIDGKEYNVLSLDFGFDQKIRTNGAVCNLPQGGIFNIKLDAGNDTLFFRWAASNELRKEVKIVFFPVTEDRNLRTIELFDTQCVKYDCDFSANNTEPIITTIRLSPAIIVQNDQLMMEKWWRNTPYSQLKKVNRFVYPRPGEHPYVAPGPDVIECYFEDTQGRKLSKVKAGEIKLAIHSRNTVGKTIDIALNETFEGYLVTHAGQQVTDNTLASIAITTAKQYETLIVEKKQPTT